MGRIKSTMIKKAARQLAEDTTLFGTGFEQNKKALGSGVMPSKSMRNKIAGYITRLNRNKLKTPKPKAIISA